MVNFFNGLEDFIAKWEGYVSYSPHMDNDLPFVRGEQGIINLNGELSCLEASIFSKASSLFQDAIEDGVKSLVVFLVYSIDCITYTSCQGHAGSECTSPSYRNVGILPRNEQEYQDLIEKLNRVKSHVDETSIDSFVKVVVEENLVDSETLSMPCIDITFIPRENYEDQYFIYLEKTYESFVEFAKQEFYGWSAKTYA